MINKDSFIIVQFQVQEVFMNEKMCCVYLLSLIAPFVMNKVCILNCKVSVGFVV